MPCSGLCCLYHRKRPQVCAGNGHEDGLQLPHFYLCVNCANNYSLAGCEFLSLGGLNCMLILGRVLPTDEITLAFTVWNRSCQKISNKNTVSLTLTEQEVWCEPLFWQSDETS